LTLTKCIKKAGKALSKSDAEFLSQSRKEYVEEGLDGKAASIRAVQDLIDQNESELLSFASKVESQGAFIPPQGVLMAVESGEDIVPITTELIDRMDAISEKAEAAKEKEAQFRLEDRKYTPEQKAVKKKGGFGERQKQTLTEKFNDLKDHAGTKLRQGMVDQFASFKSVLGDDRAWMMANLTTSASGALEAAIKYGQPFIEDNAIGIDTDKKSFQDILKPLGMEVDDWLQWMAGNRAERLSKEERENLFSDDDITALKSLSDGKLPNKKSRLNLYTKARLEFEEMSAAITEIAVETGLVNAQEAQLWEQQGFYVPFYRMLEDEGPAKGPGGPGGLVRQKAYQKLKGGTSQLDDLLTNVLMNWNHLLSASLKNQAGSAALETAVQLGIAKRVPKAVKGKDSVFIRRDGKETWYEISEDQDGVLVLDSLLALNWNGLNGTLMKAMRGFKRALTIGVTASPEFKIANLIRDTIQAIAVADMSTNIASNLYQGWKVTGKEAEIAQMVAGGGAFGDSGYIHGADPDAIKRLVKAGVKRDTILDTRNSLMKVWDVYQDFGARLENVNRAANYKQAGEKGKDRLVANFEARDHLDFARTGSWVAIRAIAQTVPFLNARLQGLDKMGRAAIDPAQRAQLSAVIGLYSLGSVLLYLSMKDDDEYERAQQWERDTYHLFKIPGSDVMYRLPRPFEVGAVATLAERLAEQMVNDKVNGQLFAERLWHTLTETFSFNPIPQMLKPSMEIYANKNSFTGRAIESQSMQRLSPERRRRASTSESAEAASIAMAKVLPSDAVLSPVQVEHLIRGYLGWLGSTGLSVLDKTITEPLSGAPSDPAMKFTEYPVIKRFARSSEPYSTRYTEVFYNRLREISEINADINDAKAARDFDEVKEIKAEGKGKIKRARLMAKLNRQIGRLRKLRERIRTNDDYTPEEKRERMDKYLAKINRLQQKGVEKTDAAFK
jgi:hypothetical protein